MDKCLNRESLKELFKNGSMPEEGSFHALIDSVVNKIEDGNVGNPEEGLNFSYIDSRKLATFPADGQWYDLISGLEGCCAFEVVAQIGKEKSGKYALLHAHALSTFGSSKIQCTQANYGWWWNKLSLRFKGDIHNYTLQIRTRSDYGQDQKIKIHITMLWNNEIMSLFK